MAKREFIEKDAAILAIANVPEGNWSNKRFVSEVEALPSADVKPVVHGEWIKKEPYEVWKCSVCEEDNMYAYSYGDDDYELQDFYCPHCGAKMDGWQEDV